MIDEDETFKQFGYKSSDFSSGSHKKIIAICDKCEKIRVTEIRRYKNLCHSCSIQGKNHPGWKGGNVVLICKQCGKKYNCVRHAIETSYFCSKTCYSKWQSECQRGENHPNWKGEHITLICKYCKKEFKITPSIKGRKFCCKECHNKWMIKYQTGENCPAWIDGRSFGKYCKLFNTQFKEKVRDFYNRRCFLCGKTQKDNSEKLSVHHVNHDKNCLCGSLCDFVPLCRICHTKITGKYIEKYWEDIIMCYLYPERYFLINV